MKIVTLLGARPQFIKAATVSRAFAAHNAASPANAVDELLVHTGQHFDANMSAVFFSELELPEPHINLEIANLSHGAMTGRMLEAIETLLLEQRPDAVLVYGDTNSTLAGALAAAKLHIPVCHVEAGLRSFNPAMPEEINRILTDRVSDQLFCPTPTAIDNLAAEGFPFPQPLGCTQKIHLVGDVMYDATLFYRDRARAQIDLAQWGLTDGGYCLCTLHRAENTDDPARLQAIFSALREINRTCPVVLPIHPRTRHRISSLNQDSLLTGLTLLEPQPYLAMQRLEMGAKAILTDSGGVQKEAFFHQVPCLTLRDETEWVETVEMGWNHLTGADRDLIITSFNELSVPAEHSKTAYGSGNASAEIVKLLIAEMN